MPAYNRPEALRSSLQALVGQDCDRGSFQVIVVDDGSPIPLQSVLDSFDYLLSIKFIRQPNSGPATARNVGAAHARSRFLAFADEDQPPAPFARWGLYRKRPSWQSLFYGESDVD